MDELLHLPLSDIRGDALLRDRLMLDEVALAALQRSILAEGLRQPVEVFALEDAAGPGHGRIAGLRRLTVFRRLDAAAPGGRFATIPAFLRRPPTLADAVAAMVGENELHAPVSPWEKGTLVLRCVDEGLFANFDGAVEALYPALTRQARSRLRGFALVVETLEGRLAEPCSLSVARMDRLAAACRAGLAELMHAILDEHRDSGAETQWRALAPAVAEAVLAPEDPEPVPGRAPRTRRALRLHSGVTLRREWTRTGWILRIDARHADHPGIVDDILDLVERWFQQG